MLVTRHVFLSEHMLTFTTVTKTYKRLTAVSNVSLTVGKGESFALLGPNGAGKSTLVKLLLDFVRPTAGAVTIDGVSSRDPLARQSVGYLPENLRIPPYLTGRQYLMRHAALAGLGGDAARAEVRRTVEVVGMLGKENVRAGTYSKGMAQRIGLAAALLGNPKLIVLDEPTTGLDPIGIREIRTILDAQRAHGATMLINSHLLSEVEKTCTTAAIMNHGRIMTQGSIVDLVRDGETLEDVFVRVVSPLHAGELA